MYENLEELLDAFDDDTQAVETMAVIDAQNTMMLLAFNEHGDLFYARVPSEDDAPTGLVRADSMHWPLRIMRPEAATFEPDWDQDAAAARVAEREAAAAVAESAALDRAIASVLCNVSNFPEPAQAALLGQYMRPLTEKLADAVKAAGFQQRFPVAPDHTNGTQQ